MNVTTQPLTFDVPAVPVAQPRQRHKVIAGHASNYTPSKHPVQDFKATCRKVMRDAYSGPPLEGPLRLSLVFVLPRPQSMIWKTRPMPRIPHAKKPDFDNLAKSVTDALSRLLWRDDSQLAAVLVVKEIAAGDEQPHVRVCVEVIQ